MDSKELAHKMLEWGALMEAAEARKQEIIEAVLEIGKTVTNGNVRATYSNPRKTYESWQDAVARERNIGEDAEVIVLVENFTTIPAPYTDWAAIGSAIKIERLSWVDETAKPSVTLKIN